MKNVSVKQKFKPVAGFHMLFAGDGGSVYTMSNKGEYCLPKKLEIKNKNGYEVVYIDAEAHYVHRLVLSAFYGGNKAPVMHIDKNKTNNKLSNLEYFSPKGLDVIGLPTHTMDRIDYYLAGTNLSTREISLELGICEKDVENYVNYLTNVI